MQLHKVLDQEESKRVAAVKKEEEMRITGIKDKVNELSAEVQTLTETIAVIQGQLKEDDMLLLKVCIMGKKKHIFNHRSHKHRHCFISF